MALTKVGPGVIQDDAVGIANLGATGTASATTFLRGDNAWASAAGGFIGYTVYTASATWTKATNSPIKVVVELVGGGGSSGSSDASYNNGGGGGSAGYVRKYIDVTLLTSAAIVVGAGGVKNAGTSAGNSSWIDNLTTISLVGGAGGNGANGAGANANGGAGGTATGGDLNMPGGNGGKGGADDGEAKTTQASALSAGGVGHLISHPSYGAATVGKPYGGGAGSGRAAGSAVDGADGAVGVVIVWEYK